MGKGATMWWVLGSVLGIGLLASRNSSAQSMGNLYVPKTLGQIKAEFGSFTFTDGDNGTVTVDPDWVAANLVMIKLFDGNKVRLHKKLASNFADIYQKAVTQGDFHPKRILGFQPRHVLSDPTRKLSLHSYGIAVDFDPQDNPRSGTIPGTISDHPGFISAFTDAGWSWGGNWTGGDRDSMHFQYAGGNV